MKNRKRKTANDENNNNNKSKNKKYRRGCVADEVPSTIALDNGDDEEPGEILDETYEQKPSIEPYKYENINEKEIFGTSESIYFLRK